MTAVKRAAGLTLLVTYFIVGSVPLRAEGTVPLKGKFAGTGSTFSGTFSQLGSFAGTIDPATGAAVWTAADGATVTALTLAFEIDFSEPISGTLYAYTQTIQITGGTGRFAGATGGVDVTGTIDVATFDYDGVVTGTISRPGTEH